MAIYFEENKIESGLFQVCVFLDELKGQTKRDQESRAELVRVPEGLCEVKSDCAERGKEQKEKEPRKWKKVRMD